MCITFLETRENFQVHRELNQNEIYEQTSEVTGNVNCYFKNYFYIIHEQFF